MDTPPLGDLPGTLLLLFNHPLSKELTVVRKLSTLKGSGQYQVSKTQLVEILGSLTDSGALNLLREFLRSNEQDLLQYAVDHPLEIVANK
jgi:hypothetical protein